MLPGSNYWSADTIQYNAAWVPMIPQPKQFWSATRISNGYTSSTKDSEPSNYPKGEVKVDNSAMAASTVPQWTTQKTIN